MKDKIHIFGEEDEDENLKAAGSSGTCEIIIILTIFGIWFYSIGR